MDVVAHFTEMFPSDFHIGTEIAQYRCEDRDCIEITVKRWRPKTAPEVNKEYRIRGKFLDFHAHLFLVVFCFIFLYSDFLGIEFLKTKQNSSA